MSADLVATLPLPQRLALSYAPRSSRDETLAVLALDARLADIVRNGSEAIIAQMKLAWWRERLAQDPKEWPLGEPLLALMRETDIDGVGLAPLVDGWEGLLAEVLDEPTINTFAQGRAVMWQAVKQDDRIAPAALEWALVDLALNLGTAGESETAARLARGKPWARRRLPRELRPLAVLHGLANRALERGSDELLDGPAAMLVALRLGITGR